MHVRYCPECDQEFRPHVERCSDCGGPLEDHLEGLAPAESERGPRGHDSLPPGDYLPLLHRASTAEIEPLAAALGRAAVPFKVDVRPGYGGFDLKVRAEDAAQAAQALAGEVGLEAAAEPAVAEGREGHCPACEAPVPSQAAECPECGLGLSQDVPACGSCGEEVDPATGRCPRCEVDSL